MTDVAFHLAIETLRLEPSRETGALVGLSAVETGWRSLDRLRRELRSTRRGGAWTAEATLGSYQAMVSIVPGAAVDAGDEDRDEA